MGASSLIGIPIVVTNGLSSRFAAVDDNQSNISIWTLPN